MIYINLFYIFLIIQKCLIKFDVNDKSVKYKLFENNKSDNFKILEFKAISK